MILRQTGLLRIEGKATSIGYSLFFVCSEAGTVCYRTSEKLQDIMGRKGWKLQVRYEHTLKAG